LDLILRQYIFDNTPLDEESAHSKISTVTTQNREKYEQTSMLYAGYGSVI
jgi:hypothetical protein